MIISGGNMDVEFLARVTVPASDFTKLNCMKFINVHCWFESQIRSMLIEHVVCYIVYKDDPMQDHEVVLFDSKVGWCFT